MHAHRHIIFAATLFMEIPWWSSFASKMTKIVEIWTKWSVKQFSKSWANRHLKTTFTMLQHFLRSCKNMGTTSTSSGFAVVYAKFKLNRKQQHNGARLSTANYWCPYTWLYSGEARAIDRLNILPAPGNPLTVSFLTTINCHISHGSVPLQSQVFTLFLSCFLLYKDVKKQN